MWQSKSFDDSIVAERAKHWGPCSRGAPAEETTSSILGRCGEFAREEKGCIALGLNFASMRALVTIRRATSRFSTLPNSW